MGGGITKNSLSTMDQYRHDCEQLMGQIASFDKGEIPDEYQTEYCDAIKVVQMWWPNLIRYGTDTTALKLLNRIRRFHSLCANKAPKDILEKELILIRNAQKVMDYMLELYDGATAFGKRSDCRHLFVVDMNAGDVQITHLQSDDVNETLVQTTSQEYVPIN